MKANKWRPYLVTLNRITNEAILDMATREMNMWDGAACLAGWAVKEALMELGKTQLDDSWGNEAYKYWGGTRKEWDKLYTGVTRNEELILIERAFVERVNLAVWGRGGPGPRGIERLEKLRMVQSYIDEEGSDATAGHILDLLGYY